MRTNNALVAAVPAILSVALVACSGPASEQSRPHIAHSGPLRVAVIDEQVVAAPRYACVEVDGLVPADERDVGADSHGADVLSVVLGLDHESCPEWAGRAHVSLHALGPHPRHGEVAASIERAVDEGAHLISLSVSFDRDFPDLRAAVSRAADRGVAIIAAAGNREGLRAGFPARYAPVISVGSTAADGTPSTFSARDADIAVVGEGIVVVRGDGRAHVSGTSFAAARLTHDVLRAVVAGDELPAALERLVPGTAQRQ